MSSFSTQARTQRVSLRDPITWGFLWPVPTDPPEGQTHHCRDKSSSAGNNTGKVPLDELRNGAPRLDRVHGVEAVAAGCAAGMAGTEPTLGGGGLRTEDGARNGPETTQERHVLNLYPLDKERKKGRKEEAAGSLQTSLKLQQRRGRWERTTGGSPESEITDAERMKQWKLIKDKSLCCGPVLGGFNCGGCLSEILLLSGNTPHSQPSSFRLA